MLQKLLGCIIWTPLIFCLLGMIMANPPEQASHLTMASLLSDKDSVKLKNLVILLEEKVKQTNRDQEKDGVPLSLAARPSSSSLPVQEESVSASTPASSPLEDVLQTLKRVSDERPRWRPIYANPAYIPMKKFPPMASHPWPSRSGKFR